MGKKSWLSLLLVVAIVLGLLVGVFSRGDGPSYRGKSLAAWVGALPAPGSTSRGITWGSLTGSETPKQSEAIDAVRHIGTNGLPYLMAEMRTSNIGVRDQAAQLWTNVKERWQRMISHTPVQRPYPQQSNEKTGAQRRHWDAARGLHALGPLAKPVIPELAKIAASGNDSSGDSAYALSSMGPDGLAALLNILTNGVTPSRGNWPQLCAIWALGQTPEAGQQAVPELLQFLHDKDWTLRMGAAWSLGRIHSQPEVIAPALAEAMGDSGFNIRPMAEQALKEYGITSVSRASLMKYLDDPKLHVRMAATNALRALFPDDAAKAGITVVSTNSPPPSQ